MTADEGTVYGRGLASPVGPGPDGTVALSAGPVNVRECLELVLATEPGERLMRPSFGAGLGRFLYEPNTPATHRLIEERVVRSIARWEPRVRLEAVGVGVHPQDRAVALVEVVYRLVATGERGGLSVLVDVDQGGGR
jgi:uncharacterized protein